jgi:hypothetical protein
VCIRGAWHREHRRQAANRTVNTNWPGRIRTTDAQGIPTAVFAYPDPRPGVPMHRPPRVHITVAGGMPGWQIALIAIGAAIFAAALAVTLDRVRTAHRQVTAPGAGPDGRRPKPVFPRSAYRPPPWVGR